MKEAFFAYPSGHTEIESSISEAAKNLNSLKGDFKIHCWPANDISGVPVTNPIFSKINDAVFVAADISFLNDNVVFEVGYAIGCSKRCLLFSNSVLKGERELARRVGIFDTLGHQNYANSEELTRLICDRKNYDPLHVAKAVDHSAPVYVVEPPRRGQIYGTLISKIKKARWKYRSFSPDEDIRLSAIDAIKHVGISAGIALYLLDDTAEGAREHNLRCMFVAGLAHGLDIPLLMVHTVNYRPPMDITDLCRKIRHPDDITELVQTFSLEITEFSQKKRDIKSKPENVLTSLRVGDPTAENEMTTLGDYYLETDDFRRTLRGETNLVVGRKGTGKTALFLQLRDEKRADKRNVVIDLKPEGYQLQKLKEKVLQLLSEGSQGHLITAFWEFIFLQEITYKVLEKDQRVHLRDHNLTELYNRLKNAYSEDLDVFAQGDFSERLMRLSENISQTFIARHSADERISITSNQITELIHSKNLRTLADALCDYLSFKREVWLIFDNIDKGWSVEGVDDTDILVLRCLIDASRKVQRELKKREIDCHTVVFIRDDVYSLLMKGSADYGKEMRASLDWSDRKLMAELLLRRLRGSGNDTGQTSDFWPTIAVSHVAGEQALDFLIDRSLMRPRNLLKINSEHSRIEVEDFERGAIIYSRDLVIEADRELGDVLPSASKLIYEFVDEKSEFSADELAQLLIEYTGGPESEVPKIVDFLIYYGILGISKGAEDPSYIFDYGYDAEMVRARMRKWGPSIRYTINPALRPALAIAN